jgi:SPX domain protein involved in polyphosphate accumulation
VNKTMIKPIFNRYERKYIVTKQQKDDLVAFFKTYLIDDPYSVDGKHYSIYNIYFDTPDFSIIRNSVQKPKYKEKLRLRSYCSPINDTDLVFLEIKKKYEGLINKRRVILSYKDAMDYLQHDIKPSFESYIDQQIMNEIDFFVKSHHAKPGAFIKYDRVALMSPNEQLRVTFDNNIIFRNTNVSLNQIDGTEVLDQQNVWLMEVKSENNFPFWLARKLSEYQLYSQSFSKYGKAYQKYLLGGTNDDYILYHY